MGKSVILIPVLLALSALPAAAKDACAERDVVIEGLQNKFSEELTAGGLQTTQPSQMMVEVWSSPDTGTFTILMTRPDGTTCIVAAGTDFFNKQPDSEPVSQDS